MAGLKKYSKGLLNFITDKICEGISLREICKTFKDDVPAEKTIYLWKKQYPECKKALDEAYQTFFYKKLDELEELSKEAMRLTSSLKSVEKDEAAAIRLKLEGLRQRIDTLKFTVAKIAPKMVPDLRDIPSTQVAVIPNINVINYSQSENPKLIE